MSLGDIYHLRGPVVIQPVRVKAGAAASIKAGEPVIQNSADANYVKSPGASVTVGAPLFAGIAVTTSDDTVAANGTVYIAMPSPTTVFRGKAKTIASLADTVRLTKVVIDFTTPNYTIDESTTTNGLCQILNYDSTTGSVDFVVDMSAYLNA